MESIYDSNELENKWLGESMYELNESKNRRLDGICLEQPNIGENPMPWKPNGCFARFIHGECEPGPKITQMSKQIGD